MGIEETIAANGWRQGSLVDTKPLADYLPEGEVADYVVATHSCDLLHHDFGREPSVELIPRRRIDTTDGNLTHAKSPRAWHLRHGDNAYELLFADRVALPRHVLAAINPSGSLPDDETRVLKRWLASRYGRAEFADAFNRRLSGAARRIAKILKRRGESLSGLYLVVSSEELPTEVDYEIEIIATMGDDNFGDASIRMECQEALSGIASAVDECAGICVIEFELKSETGVSLADLRVLSRWDYDHLTIRTDPSAMSPGEEDT